MARQKLKIALVTILNQNALGARYLISSIRKSGHKADLILFKLFRFKLVKRSDIEEIKKVKKYMEETGQDLVYRYTPFGNNYLPHPSPVTEKEIELFLKVIEENNYDVIGFSLLAPNIPIAIRLTKEIKKHFPEKIVLWGGVEPTLSPEKYIQYADAIVRGEGEEALVEFLDNPNRTDIEGFWIRKKDGEIIKNPVRKLIQDLDKLPFPSVGDCEIIIDEDKIRYDLMNYPDFHRDCYIAISSRGCPFKCSYCVHSKMKKLFPHQKYVRQRSVENFIEELKWITDKYDFSNVPLFFNDEIFAQDINWVRKFTEIYKKEINLPFFCYCHIKFTPKEVLKLLLEAGLIFPSYGLQSGSKRLVTNIYHRPYIEKKEFVQRLKTIFEIGYKIFAIDLLTECKFETEEDLKETFNFLVDLPKPYILQLAHVVAFPNTELYDMYVSHKNNFTKISEKKYYFWAMLYLLTQYPDFSKTHLEILSKSETFKNNPEFLDLILFYTAKLYPDINKFLGYEIPDTNEKGITLGRNFEFLLPEIRKNEKNKYEKKIFTRIKTFLKSFTLNILDKVIKLIKI